jgi:hypothetical protein
MATATRCAGLPLSQRCAGQVRQPGGVRHVQHDDARRTGSRPDAGKQRRVVGAERADLCVHVAVRIGSSGAAAERRRHHVDLVDARENRHEGCVGLDERHLLIDEVAGDDAVVLLSQRLKVTADDSRGNAQIEERDVEALGFQRSRGDGHIPHPAGAFVEGDARGARSDAVRVARAHRTVNDCRSGRRRSARFRWAFSKA